MVSHSSLRSLIASPKGIVSQKSIAITIIVGVGGFLCFSLMGAVFCAATLHVPRKVRRTPPNAVVVSVIASDNARLSAWWLRPDKPNGNCVLVLHGINDSRVGSIGFAPMFLLEGYTVLLPDSRGHGTSEGRFVTYGLLEKYDVVAWTDWMKRAGCRKLYALGESLGASTLILAASIQSGFAAIVAECPYADLREIANYRLQQMLGIPTFFAVPIAKLVVSSGVLYARWVEGLDLHQVSPLGAIAGTATPILLIHGLKDFKTPPSHSKKLVKANPRNPLWLVPNAPHTGALNTAPNEFRRRVLAWFASH